MRMENLDYLLSLSSLARPSTLASPGSLTYLHKTLYSLKTTEIKETGLKLRVKGKGTF